MAENAASVSSAVKWRSPSMRVWMYGLRDADILLVLFFGVVVLVEFLLQYLTLTVLWCCYRLVSFVGDLGL